MSLTPLRPDQFHLDDQNLWASKTKVVDNWELPSRSLAALDLNREESISVAMDSTGSDRER